MYISTHLQGLYRQVCIVYFSICLTKRWLIVSNLSSRKPATGPLLNRMQIIVRLQFATEHTHWSLDDWKKTFFIDTCNTRVSLKGPDGHEELWRRQEKICTVLCIAKGTFWRCFSDVRRGRGFEARTGFCYSLPLPNLNAQRYVHCTWHPTRAYFSVYRFFCLTFCAFAW